MTDSELIHPLKMDQATGEPYLQLAPPFEHIVLTPQRLSDMPAAVRNMNDPRVYMYITGPPLPYTEAHALDWFERCTQECQETMAQLRAGQQFVGACPVRAIRDTSAAGFAEAPIIGDCGFDRLAVFAHAGVGEEEQARLREENMAREVGDPGITWTIGYYMDPSHHGKGIMTAVVRALVEQWAVPRLNARHIVVSALTGNRGSVRVFEKNGFSALVDVPDVVQMSEARGGGRTGLHVLEWKREESPSPTSHRLVRF